MAFTYLVGVFRQGTKQPLINVTVAEVDSSNNILNSAKTNSAGFAVIQPSDEEFIPKVLVSGNYVHDVDVIITGLGAGVGPFEYDYLIDPAWANVVSAGRGSEGQLIPTFHGHTFRVYSTINAALTHGIANFSRSFSIRLVPATYPEQLIVGGIQHEVHIHGSGPDNTIVGGNVLAHQISPSTDTYFYDLTLNTSSGQGIFKSSNTQEIFVECHNVFFRKPMSGTQAGSNYYGCNFEQGWSAKAGDESQTITIIGGRTGQPFDFQTNNVPTNQWQMVGFKTVSTGSKMKFYRLSDSFIELLGGSAQTDVAAIDVSGNIRNTTIAGIYKGSTDAAQPVMHFALSGNFQSDGVKIIATFVNNNGTGVGDRFINQDGTGTARGWHIDIACAADGTGDFIEDHGGLSVEMDSAEGCKFTLVPHDKATVLINAGSNNVVDAGVIDGSSVGTDYATPGEHEHTGTGDGGDTIQPANYKLPAATELTIATGEITVTQSHHTIDTEADAASDDLDTINGLVANQLYVLRPENDARSVVLKHGTGNISCVNGADITLDDVEDFVWALSPDGTNVYVLFDTQGAGGSVDAADVTYTPLVLTDWDTDADPGNVDDALDQLAERVDDVEGAAGHDASEIIDDDSDTYVRTEESADEDIVRVGAGGSEIFQVRSGGLFIANAQGVVIGHTAKLTAAGSVPEFQMLGQGAQDTSLLIGAFNVGNEGPELAFLKSDNGTVGTNTIVSDGNLVGRLTFYPADGVDFDTRAAVFEARVDDASPAAGDVGMEFVWYQMPGGGGVLRETMHLHADGNLHLHEGVLYIHEKAAAEADDAGAGQFWVKTATPNQAYFTDDAGNDKRIDAIPIDISFVFEADDLATGVFVAPQGIAVDLLALLTNANVTDANAFVYAETAGTGTNTILIETTSTNPWTGSPTWATVATLNLGTAKRATAAFSGTYNPTTQYLRARCSAVGATAPQKVHARISALGVVA